MEFGSVILLVLFSYSTAVNRFNQVSAEQKNFKIIVDETKVEKLAVQWATQKPGFLSKITNIVLKRLTICGRGPEVKAEFCRQFLPTADLGLKIDNFYEEELNCEPKTFHIRHLTNEQTDNYTIDMYSCPEIIYNDLETEEETFINHNYYVSNGREYNSAVVFIQKRTVNADEKIYPKNYMKKIVFEKLVFPLPDENVSSEISLPETNSDSSFVESQALASEETRKLKRPYEKFRRSFFSVNLCGLRKSYKVHMCRQSIRASHRWYAQLQPEGYDEYLCRRRRVRLVIPVGQGAESKISRPVEKELVLLLCPRIDATVLDSNDDFVYLSSNLLSSSVFFFTRRNERGEPFARRSLVDKLSWEKIAEDRRRSRFLLYPSVEEREKELRESRTSLFDDLAERTDLAKGSVRQPTMIAKFGPTPSSKTLLLGRLVVVDNRKYVVEDALLSFSRIKATKLVYSRFKMTHWSFDICQQPKRIRRQLCNDILRLNPYGYEVNLHEKNIDYQCSRRTVHLRAREIEHLQPMDFWMWQCPKPISHVQYNFFIAKCHLNNSALVFRTSALHPGADVYPDALVTEIKRDYLSSMIKEKYA